MNSNKKLNLNLKKKNERKTAAVAATKHYRRTRM